MIDAHLQFPAWIERFEDVDQVLPALQFVEIVGEIELGHIDPVLFEKLGFKFAVAACAHEPEGHGFDKFGDGSLFHQFELAFDPFEKLIHRHGVDV